MTLSPLRLSFDIDCPAAHAFTVWTTQITAWWPKGHSTSGDPRAVVMLEGHAGGRIYERTSDGREIDWGQITEWEPPRRFSYRWHIGTDAEHATDVELTFVDAGGERTRLDIVQSGWERLGAGGEQYRDQNASGWGAAIVSFRERAERSS
jgi:uncharacterized protein YndB with AHSA1/START domain